MIWNLRSYDARNLLKVDILFAFLEITGSFMKGLRSVKGHYTLLSRKFYRMPLSSEVKNYCFRMNKNNNNNN